MLHLDNMMIQAPVAEVFPFSIRLSPAGLLHFVCSEPALLPSSLNSIHQEFLNDWRVGWFLLAAEKPLLEEPSLRFWQRITSHFLTALCHFSIEEEYSPVPPPDTDILNEWILQAPPMVGGEYLSTEKILQLWKELNKWTSEAVELNGGIHHLLAKYAPKWQQVGRVCFHLACGKQEKSGQTVCIFSHLLDRIWH